MAGTLLQRLWSNDIVAWKRFTELYGPTVYGWCRTAGLQPEDASDITQNVFQAVYTGLNRFRKDRPGDRFRDWLWTVTRHRIIDHLRKLRSAPVGVGGSEAHMQWQQMQVQVINVLSALFVAVKHGSIARFRQTFQFSQLYRRLS